MKRGRAPTLAAALCAALSMASTPAAEPQVPSLAAIRARDFEVTLLDGTTAPLAELLGSGKPLVVEFWATWCAPCRKTLPHLIGLKRAHGDELEVVGLTVEDPEEDVEKVREYVKQHGIAFPIAFAPRELFQFMNNRPDIAVPKLFVFDQGGGAIVYIPRYSPFTGRRLETAVERMFADRRNTGSGPAR